MASVQVVETSATNNSPSQGSNRPDDLFQSRYVTPGFKRFSFLCLRSWFPITTSGDQGKARLWLQAWVNVFRIVPKCLHFFSFPVSKDLTLNICKKSYIQGANMPKPTLWCNHHTCTKPFSPVRWPTGDMLQIKKMLQIKESCCKLKNFAANKKKLLQIK